LHSPWVWEESPTRGTDLLTLLAIADNAADDGANAWPSLARLARKTRLDERTVRRILRRLEDGGHLQVQVAAGPRGTNRYTVLMTPGKTSGGQIDPGQEVPGIPRQRAPRADSPPGNPPATPDTTVSPHPGHSYAPRTSFTSNRTSPRTRAVGGSSGGKPPTQQRGAALPPPTKAPNRCPRHPGQYAGFCGLCRSESLGRTS
jgi:hypothetical protein